MTQHHHATRNPFAFALRFVVDIPSTFWCLWHCTASAWRLTRSLIYNQFLGQNTSSFSYIILSLSPLCRTMSNPNSNSQVTYAIARPERSEEQELLHVGRQCSHQSCMLVDFLPIKCLHCSAPFCQDHFLPESHSCEKWDKREADRRVLECTYNVLSHNHRSPCRCRPLMLNSNRNSTWRRPKCPYGPACWWMFCSGRLR